MQFKRELEACKEEFELVVKLKVIVYLEFKTSSSVIAFLRSLPSILT